MTIRFARSIFLVLVLAFVTIAAAPPPPPEPNVTFQILTPLPDTMVIGQSYEFQVMVTSDTPFNSAAAMPDIFFPGRHIVSHGVSKTGKGTTAILVVMWEAKSSTAELPGGVAPIAIVVGARFHGGVVVSQRFEYNIAVP